jgi:hypothetical protein
MAIVVGLVAEGAHDIPIIEAIVSAELARCGIADVVFRKLQPVEDATGRIESGGWSKVIGWLRANCGEHAETYFEPLFEGDLSCHMIAVHLDSDIHDACLRGLGLPELPQPASISTLLQSLTAAIDLAFSLPPHRQAMVAHAIAVHKTENWILACFAECDEALWTTSDAKSALKAARAQQGFSSLVAMKREAVIRISDGRAAATRARSYSTFTTELKAIGAQIGPSN